jgi:class I fructose-bisphosphate aldolase
MSNAVEQIIANYAGEIPGVIGNLRRLLNTGTLAGTGKLVILPVDQGFEHGPARSFAPNPAGYDPEYHASLALEAGCNAYAAPLGFIEAVAHKYAGKLPFILKVNNSDSLGGPEQPCSALTSNIEDALRLGCSAIGYTIYPGSGLRNEQYQAIRDLIAEARAVGLPTVIWSYPRGEGVSKNGETALDVVAYAAHVACQLGAHIVKVKPPTDFIEQKEAQKHYEKVPKATLAERVQHVVQSSFNGKRIVIFSGGAAKGTSEVLDELRQIAKGGGFGSIMGRNAFQRSPAEGAKLLRDAMEIFKAESARL